MAMELQQKETFCFNILDYLIKKLILLQKEILKNITYIHRAQKLKLFQKKNQDQLNQITTWYYRGTLKKKY